ncbi:MAG: ABC transporter transmembrane domain-containing protein, partial [Gammaproteobacteria bacterium]|nr:ABC transporter transmembrane domain-containing protein [Gammaproteobacteria bacterium]
MTNRIDPRARIIYRRLWRYVVPYKLVAVVAVVGMASTALIEASLVYLLEPLMDEALVAQNLETVRWMPIAFIAIFVARGVSGFATELSLGWIGRNVISSLRRDVFRKFLTLPARFFESHSTGPLLSRLTYNVEMVAE